MFFRDIVGQENIKKVLRDNINNGRVAHAQLFEGKSGYGSLALALAYATYLNCENKSNGEACGQCKSCFTMENLTHPNLHFVYPSNKTKMAESFYNDGSTAKVTSDSYISIWRKKILESNGYITEYDWYQAIGMGDVSKNTSGIIGHADAKSLIEKLQYKSIGKGYKVVIIWLPERMNTEAANTLLKEFEEPSKSTLFLFVTENRANILPTVLSRTQQFTIPQIDNGSIEIYLQEKGFDKNLSSIIAGDMNTLKSIVYKSDDSIDTSSSLDLFKELMGICYLDNYNKLIEWCNDFSTLNREEIKMFFTEAMRILRLCYLRSIGMNSLTNTSNKEDIFISKFHPYINDINIEAITEAFEKCFLDISRNGNNRAVMTHFTLTLCKYISKKNIRK
ncbi:MAG: hypothetical protein RRZ64_07235 [Rikenellaceae bacterium]